MKCTSVRARADVTESGRRIVGFVVGNFRPVGYFDPEAWVEMPPDMARSLAQDLIDAANKIEREEVKAS